MRIVVLVGLAGICLDVSGCGVKLSSPSFDDFGKCAQATQMHVAAWKEFNEIRRSSGPLEPASGAGKSLSAAKMFVHEVCVKTGILTAVSSI